MKTTPPAVRTRLPWTWVHGSSPIGGWRRLPVLMLAICLSLMSNKAGSATAYHSPSNDGSAASAPLPIPSDDTTVDINLWISNDRGTGLSDPPSERCVGRGHGDEICGWDVHVRGTSAIEFVQFMPGPGVYYLINTSAEGPLLRANRVNAVDADSIKEPIGTLRIRTSQPGSGRVEVVGSVYVDSQLNLVQVDGPGWGTALAVVDSDRDGVPDDGDGSGDATDNPCSCQAAGSPPGCDQGCDDNCAFRLNPSQLDRGGVASPQFSPGDGSPDGVGDACQCGDMNADGEVNAIDVVLYRRHFGGHSSPFSTDRCSVVGNDGACNTTDLLVMRRTLGGLTTGIVQNVCPAYVGLPDPAGP